MDKGREIKPGVVKPEPAELRPVEKKPTEIKPKELNPSLVDVTQRAIEQDLDLSKSHGH